MEETRQDRISSLPDNLIHHILSFIDMKYAVLTSALSKRWKTTWISLPYLNFTWSGFVEGKDNLNDSSIISKELIRFVDFVYMVFMFRDDSDIQTLKIYLDWSLWTTRSYDEISRSFDRWIFAAVRRHVKEVSINIDYNHEVAYELPYQLLNCKSLRKLSVFGASSGAKYANIVLPKSASLPQLKQLLLVGVSTSYVELNQRLFNSSPLLELLIIVNCDLQNDNQQSIIVDSLSYERFGDAYFSRYFWSQNRTMVDTTKVPAPNLTAFDCKDFLTQKFPSVDDARFSMLLKGNKKDESADTYSQLPAEEKKVYAERLIKLLQAVPNVERLKLSSGFLEVLPYAPDVLNFRFLQFCNLQHLELKIWLTKGCLHSLAYLLNISPNIKSILLTSKESNSADIGDDWEEGLGSPCVLSHLEYVEIKEVEGSDNELKLLCFLLKNAKILKKLHLFTRSTVGLPSSASARLMNRIRDTLTEFPTETSRIKVSCYLDDVLLTCI